MSAVRHEVVAHEAVVHEAVGHEASAPASAAANAASEPAASTDRYAPGLLDARLGREPQDVIEAAIVLEAWAGRPAREAIASASALVDRSGSPVLARGHFEPDDELDRNSVVGEALALVLSILSVAAWASPLNAHFGAHPLAQAIRVSLPVAIAIQWILRSRYLSRRQGLSLLARDAIPLSALILLLIDLPLVCTVSWGPLAALMITIWAAGTILTRRGWGLLYAAVLAGATVALRDLGDPYLPLGALACVTILLCAAAVLTRRTSTDERSGGVARALLAGTLGGCLGLLLVADPSLGWGVRGSYPALALLPAVLGSFWGGYHLWNLYEAIPRGLRGVPLDRASRVGLGDPAMRVFAGSVLRLIVTTTTLSALLLLAGSWIGGTDAVSVFVAFGCASLISMVVSLMESLSLQRIASIALAAALATEAAVQHVAHWQLPGAALAAGAGAGLILTVPPMLSLLARSGRVLATTMWIR